MVDQVLHSVQAIHKGQFVFRQVGDCFDQVEFVFKLAFFFEEGFFLFGVFLLKLLKFLFVEFHEAPWLIEANKAEKDCSEPDFIVFLFAGVAFVKKFWVDSQLVKCFLFELPVFPVNLTFF